MNEALLSRPHPTRHASVASEILTCNMDNKQKTDSQGGSPRTTRSYLFACFPVARRKSAHFLSSAILVPHGGARGSESRHRGWSYHSASKSSVPYSGPLFSKIPAHTERQSLQEPTSPEVTCLGHVRVKETQFKARDAAMALEKFYHEKRQKFQNTSSEAKQRMDSFTGPKQSTWRQLLGSRGSVSPQACPTEDTDTIDLRRFSSSCKVSASYLSPSYLAPGRSMSSTAGMAFAKSLWHLRDETNSNKSEDENEEAAGKD